MTEPKISGISRRKFITGGTCALAAGALYGAVGSAGTALGAPPAMGQWPYAPLDPAATARAAWAPSGCSG